MLDEAALTAAADAHALAHAQQHQHHAHHDHDHHHQPPQLDPIYAQFRDQTRFWVQRVAVPMIMVVGLFGNLITVIIMTRRRMRSTTNMYLAALAFVDMLYLVLTFLLGLSHYPNMARRQYRFYWHLKPFLMMLTDACSNTSVWLTVTFTIERFIAVRFPMRGKVWCTEARAKRQIVCVFLFAILFALPVPFEWQVIEKRAQPAGMARAGPAAAAAAAPAPALLLPPPHAEGTSHARPPDNSNLEALIPYKENDDDDADEADEGGNLSAPAGETGELLVALENTDFGRNETYKTIYYWSTAAIFYFIPLLSLTFFNGFLIQSVHRSRRERNKMTGRQSGGGGGGGEQLGAGAEPAPITLSKPQARAAAAAAAKPQVVAASKSTNGTKPARLDAGAPVLGGSVGSADGRPAALANERPPPAPPIEGRAPTVRDAASSEENVHTTGAGNNGSDCDNKSSPKGCAARLPSSEQAHCLMTTPSTPPVAPQLGAPAAAASAQSGRQQRWAGRAGGGGGGKPITRSSPFLSANRQARGRDNSGSSGDDDAADEARAQSKRLDLKLAQPGGQANGTSSRGGGVGANLMRCNAANADRSPSTSACSVAMGPNAGATTTTTTTTSTSSGGGGGHSSQERRITIMLISVVILFLVCQIPSAAMLLYTSVRETLPNTNEHALLLAFGNIFNFLMAVNAAGNFILYSFLSKKYRRTFVILFCGCLRRKAAAGAGANAKAPCGADSTAGRPAVARPQTNYFSNATQQPCTQTSTASCEQFANATTTQQEGAERSRLAAVRFASSGAAAAAASNHQAAPQVAAGNQQQLILTKADSKQVRRENTLL